MDPDNIRSPSVLSDINMNIQDNVVIRTSPVLFNSFRNSPTLNENEKEVIDTADQENKLPVNDENVSSSAEDSVFKKPPYREMIPKEECTLNWVVDRLNQLQLGSTPVRARRFNHMKWTTPLKRKTPQSDGSCASSEYDKAEEEISETTEDSSSKDLAKMDQIEDSQPAYILEKYLTEQDFKLEISLSDMSFNSAVTSIDIDSSIRNSTSIQTENTISGSLFTFGNQEKSVLCLSEQLNLNDVTTQVEHFKDVSSFAKENDPQTEDTLFNLITDYLVQNETGTSFDGKSEENMFTLSRISEANFLRINTVEEEDALLQQPARKSLLLQLGDIDSNQSHVNKSKIEDDQVPLSPVLTKIETETANKSNEPNMETSLNEITSIMSRSSISVQESDADYLSANSSAIGYEDDSIKGTIKKNSSIVETYEFPCLEPVEIDEICVEDNRSFPVAELNEAVGLGCSTTIDEIGLEINKELNKTPDSIRRTPDATINTESTPNGSLFEKSVVYANETAEPNVKQNLELTTHERIDDLEVSQQFSLKIENASVCHENSSETIDFEKTRTFNDQDSLESNRTVVETTHTTTEKVEHDSQTVNPSTLKLNRTYSDIPADVIDEEMNKPSSNLEKLNETVNLETTSVIVENSIERQASEVDQTSEADIAEVVDDPDSLKSNRTFDLETTHTIEKIEEDNAQMVSPNPMTLNQTYSNVSAHVVDEKINEPSSNQVKFNDTSILETPSVIVENSIERQTSKVESTTDQNCVILETIQSDNLESTRIVEKKTNEIAECNTFNRTFDLEANESSHDLSVCVKPSFQNDETEDSKVILDIREEIGEIQNCSREVNQLELEIEKNDAVEEIQQPAGLSTTVEMDFTLSNADFDHQNETVNFENPTTINEKPSKLSKTINSEISYPEYDDGTHSIPYSPEPVDISMEIEELRPDSDEIVTDVVLQTVETKINILPTSVTESILRDSPCRFEFADYSGLGISKETINRISKETETSNSNNSNQSEDTVMIQGSPCPRRSDSPCQFDTHAIPVNETASPIPPNSPNELSNKWRTQIDLSTVSDRLECFSGGNSPSNSGDELDITDPVDSNLAPEMLSVAKLPLSMNLSHLYLESIPEVNESEESTSFKKNDSPETKDLSPLKTSTKDAESKPETVSNQITICIASEENEIDPIIYSTPMSMSVKTESKLDISATVGASLNSIDSISKTPIAEAFSQPDFYNSKHSNFNADYCCARTTSTKSIHPSKQPVLENSPFVPLRCTPKRKLGLYTPEASGDIPTSLLDMSIGCFEKYTATQVGTSKLPEMAMNKTIDVDEAPQLEETKLLCFDEPSRSKINVKTQTHDTELSDLRAENIKLKEDLNSLIEQSQAAADREIQLRRTAQTLFHNEAELKKVLLELEDNNRKLSNKYELLIEYSNELLASRNKELDEAEEEIRALRNELHSYLKKAKTEESPK